jgi:hypothetical protein
VGATQPPTALPLTLQGALGHARVVLRLRGLIHLVAQGRDLWGQPEGEQGKQ